MLYGVKLHLVYLQLMSCGINFIEELQFNSMTHILDIDECLLLVDDCLESQRCLNTPGSFKCIRTISCGTGYVIDSENTEECIGE